MSIASEITRLQEAKADIKSAIEAKGVTVPSSALLDTFDTYIASIPGGGGKAFETGTVTFQEDVVRPEINFANTHSVPPAILIFYDATGTIQATNSGICMAYVDVWRLFGIRYTYGSGQYRYGFVTYIARSTSTSSNVNGTVQMNYTSDETEDTSNSYPRYWASTTSFHPSVNNTSRYWRAGRTYKWIAVWA